MTNEFTDVMHSLGLFSKIPKPKRIISYFATLTDNIFFTNNMTNKTVSGILINVVETCQLKLREKNVKYKRDYYFIMNEVKVGDWYILLNW